MLYLRSNHLLTKLPSSMKKGSYWQTFKTVDEYIKKAPPEVRDKLISLRKTIKAAAPPEAQEKISYQIPTFTHHGNLVHFAAFKDHLSLFPGSSGVEAFKKELVGYKTSKGTIQFPLDKPLPMALITKIVKFRVKENESGRKNVPEY